MKGTGFETGLGVGSAPSEESPIKEYLSVLWMRRSSILIVAALVTGATLFHSSQKQHTYRSAAEILLYPISLTPSLGFGAPFPIGPEMRLISSADVLELAREKAGELPAPAAVVVAPSPPTNSMTLTAASASAVAAQRMAQAHAEAYLEFRRTETERMVERAARLARSQLRALDAEIADAERAGGSGVAHQARFGRLINKRTELESRAEQAAFLETLEVGRVIQPAPLPAEGSSGNSRTLMFGLFAGLALGTAQVFVRARLDPRLRSRRDLAIGAGAPVLALLPESPGDDATGQLASPHSPDAEAYRELRATVLFAATALGLRSLVVTGINADDETTSTSVNLAAFLARAGKRVVLVEGGLSERRLDQYFPSQTEVGLTSVLSGQVAASGALQLTSVPGLVILHRGPRNTHAPELLASGAFRAALGDLEAGADLIIVDAPPVLAGADTLAIAPHTDGVVLVAEAERTTSAELGEARLRLEQVGARLVGAIMTNVDKSQARIDQRVAHSRKATVRGAGDESGGGGGWSA